MSSTNRIVWTIPVETEQTILESLLEVARGKSQEGQRPITARERISAGKVLATLKKLDLAQQALQLRRERQEGKASEVSLAGLVGDAERRAEIRRREHET
jgi:hypothetical protein